MSIPAFLLHDIAVPAGISYLSVYLDQKWHAVREYKTALARAISLGKDSERLPDKMTIKALYTAAIFELEYRCEQAGRDFEETKAKVNAAIGTIPCDNSCLP